MLKWLIIAEIVVIAILVYQIQNPECVRVFAHSETETIPYIECQGD